MNIVKVIYQQYKIKLGIIVVLYPLHFLIISVGLNAIRIA
jgi:hypothetical protein